MDEPNRVIKIEVRFVLPGRFWWLLLACVATGDLRLTDAVLDKVTFIVRALLPG